MDPCLNGNETTNIPSILQLYLSPIPLNTDTTKYHNKIFISNHKLTFPDKKIRYEFIGEKSLEWKVNTKDYIIHNNNEKYYLESFHFHKHGEHTINGKHFDCELHFVFPNYTNNKMILVLGILFNFGKHSSKIIKSLIKGKSFSLPNSIENNFCTYNGSLTNVNLEDIDAAAVNWNILTLTGSITREDYNILYHKFRNSSKLRPTNGRNVIYIKKECDIH